MSLPTASRDFQPSPATTPLLEAVRQRQPAAASTLLGHWVHRHGLSGLDRFRAQVLVPELGREADAWLQSLLDLDAVPLGADLPVPVTTAAQPEAGGSEPISRLDTAAPPLPAGVDLRARAEAAVDAAFAALEHSFPAAGLSLSDPDPQASSPPLCTVVEPPPETEMTVAAMTETEPTETKSSPAANVLDAAEEAPMGVVECSRTATFSSLWRRLDRQRERGLRQLRGVLRDCLEETVSPLRESQPHEPDQSWDLPLSAQSDIALPAAEPPQPQAMALPEPAPEMPASLLDRLTRVRPLQQGRRPAPAPSALSDLRSWLPQSSDLPRAS